MVLENSNNILLPVYDIQQIVLPIASGAPTNSFGTTTSNVHVQNLIIFVCPLRRYWN